MKGEDMEDEVTKVEKIAHSLGLKTITYRAPDSGLLALEDHEDDEDEDEYEDDEDEDDEDEGD